MRMRQIQFLWATTGVGGAAGLAVCSCETLDDRLLLAADKSKPASRTEHSSTSAFTASFQLNSILKHEMTRTAEPLCFRLHLLQSRNDRVQSNSQQLKADSVDMRRNMHRWQSQSPR